MLESFQKWFLSHYDVFKDFSGPVVTLVAAATAAWITYRFGKIQSRIANAQKDIAFEKLKVDLFERQYAIYAACKKLLETIVGKRDSEKIDWNKIRELRIVIGESRFFFPDKLRSMVQLLDADCEKVMNTIIERETANLDDEENWSKLAHELSKQTQKLHKWYGDLPEIFEDALAFNQLRNKSSNNEPIGPR